VLGAGQAACALGTAEVPSQEVGLAILSPLRDLDEVAYLRFGSVYRSFSSIEDFEKEIRHEKTCSGNPAPQVAKPRRVPPAHGRAVT
jgi:transcriptional regulator NrdR family protein